MGTSAYDADYDLVKALGPRNASLRSASDTAAAAFWVGYGSQVTGLWVNTLLAQPAVRGWDLEKTARFFARRQQLQRRRRGVLVRQVCHVARCVRRAMYGGWAPRLASPCMSL